MDFLRTLFYVIGILALLGIVNCSNGTESVTEPEDENKPSPVEEEALAFPGAEGFGRNARVTRTLRFILIAW